MLPIFSSPWHVTWVKVWTTIYHGRCDILVRISVLVVLNQVLLHFWNPIYLKKNTLEDFRRSQSYGIFLHIKSWVPGGENSISTVVMQKWRSPLRQFARAMTMDEYDVAMPVPHVRVMSHINCGDVTILSQKSQKRPPLAKKAMAKSKIDDCIRAIVSSGHKIACSN